MLLSKVLDFYKTQSKLAKALGLHRQQVHVWCVKGYKYIPELYALKLEKLSDGSLRYDSRVYKK